MVRQSFSRVLQADDQVCFANSDVVSQSGIMLASADTAQRSPFGTRSNALQLAAQKTVVKGWVMSS